jgi:cell division protein ZapA
MKRELTIHIAGQALTIRSDEDEAYVARLASSVDSKIREISRGQPGITTLNLALMAALTIADEALKSKAAQDDVERLIERLSERIESELGFESA